MDEYVPRIQKNRKRIKNSYNHKAVEKRTGYIFTGLKEGVDVKKFH